MTTLLHTALKDSATEHYRVSVDEYRTFRSQGYLVVRGLVSPADVGDLITHTDNLLAGREMIPGMPPPTPEMTADEKLQHWLRIHMLHRVSPIHERFMLHPRILDVLEALIGPDVLALQTMLFFKQPGQPGQGYHQDAYYIPTFPDTLCGAWLAIDEATEDNGCMWMTVGSQHEPIFPDPDNDWYGQRELAGMHPIRNASDTDETANGLRPIAQRYAGHEVKVEAQPGDVVFFGGHILHRSHSNRSNHSRRAFVGHYCNARSWVPWNAGDPYPGDSANDQHILARGTTHLPFAQPRFGTPCAATEPPQPVKRARIMSMMADKLGKIGMSMHADKPDED